MHESAWALTLVFVSLLAVVFLLVIARSGSPGDYARIQSNAGRIRTAGFWLLLLAGAGLTVATLYHWPHGASAAARQGGATAVEPLVITATGAQWSWELSTDRIPAGRPVTFAVTSTDVNHGFGIYDETLRLITQIQAMPGYVNRLHHVFEQAGRYRVLCMEYCGLVHHDMIAEFTVTPEGE